MANYLKENKVNISKLNQTISPYLKPCFQPQKQPEYCQETILGDLLNIYEFNNKKINIIQHHNIFYIQDKNKIVVAFNSTKITTIFKINIKNYQIKF